MDDHPQSRAAGSARHRTGRPATGRRGATAAQQLGLAAMALERARRGALARMRRSRLLRWRYRSPAAEELLLAPPDLRAADASFADELADGGLGLAGTFLALEGTSPFAIPPPSPAWSRELHGFGWLRHLDAACSADARALARRLAAEWLARGRRSEDAWAPAVTGRRLVSWLSHAGLLLEGADRRRYAALMRSLTKQVTWLAASWRDAPDGYPRLLALIALVHADLCIAGHERQLATSQRLLAAELIRQVPPDGGHTSRNPQVLIELMLDLLPLRQCFPARSIAPGPELAAAIGRITAMVRHLCLGDGSLARFNGMGGSERDLLATVLAYDHDRPQQTQMAVRSGYGRLQRGGTVVLVDAGAPPPLELAAAACAGCLSFEMSAGAEPLLVNCGMPGLVDATRGLIARSTAWHNTLCLGEQSSARLVRDARLEHEIGGVPLTRPDNVTCAVRETADGGIVLEASHDGYAERFGLLHGRTLALDASGTRLSGRDRLDAANGVVRFAWDVPLAIHFHVHPDVEVCVGEAPDTVELVGGSGERWRLAATGAAPSIEESLYVADPARPRSALQVVLRAQCCGVTEVGWTLERIAAGKLLTSRESVRRRADSRLTERLAEARAGFEEPDEETGT